MKDEAIYRRLFRTALLIRLVEERIIELYPSDKIQSPVHLSIGQEAVAVGVCDGLQPDDLVFATYRSHGFYIAKGGSLDAMFAELYGRKGGVSGGKAGSMHLRPRGRADGIVGGGGQHHPARGRRRARASQRRGASQVAVAVFGDGATEEGVYHESLNFAALMKVPVLFLCEDNGLAVHSHRPARQSYQPGRSTPRLVRHRQPPAGGGLGHAGDPPGHPRCAAASARRREPFVLEIATWRYKEHVGVGEDFHFNYRSASRRRCLEARGIR